MGQLQNAIITGQLQTKHIIKHKNKRYNYYLTKFKTNFLFRYVSVATTILTRVTRASDNPKSFKNANFHQFCGKNFCSLVATFLSFKFTLLNSMRRSRISLAIRRDSSAAFNETETELMKSNVEISIFFYYNAK